ncbi:MAG: hypothetical protein GYB64_09105 [Chloroflexi bacterium]|nr:hypothetical protein [Chloroflexota bacterium]
MSVTTPAVRTRASESGTWLHSRNWDLTFITLSVVLVAVPYLAYLGLLALQPAMAPMADWFGTTPADLSRNIVNATVALLVGGPHMYATFTRTAFDADYRKKRPRMIWTSLAIPVVVFALAIANLQLLLTIFFFWASIHVLHQIVFITEMYNHRAQNPISAFSRASDYAVILTSLYPLAAYKMWQGNFAIGLNDVGATVGQVLGIFGLSLGPWMVWLTGGVFGIALVVWLGKTIWEWQKGVLHAPKALFIFLTVTASFFVPALGNLDTAFQGMNFWHSLQYLALTWMLNNIRLQRGDMERKPWLQRMSEDGSARRYYLFNMGLTLGDIGLAVVLFLVMVNVFGKSFDYAFDRAYYMAVLSFLWIHYYHDHHLFTEPEVIDYEA